MLPGACSRQTTPCWCWSARTTWAATARHFLTKTEVTLFLWKLGSVSTSTRPWSHRQCVCSTFPRHHAMATALTQGAQVGRDSVVIKASFSVTRQRNAVKIKYTGTRWSTNVDTSGNVRCRRLLISAIPTLENLVTFMDITQELDNKETAILSQVTNSIFSSHVMELPSRAACKSTNIVPDARYGPPSVVGIDGSGTTKLVQGYTVSLTPNWTVDQALPLVYTTGGVWGATSGSFIMPPQPTGLLFNDLHLYFPRFKQDPLSWAPLFDKLFELQVPQQPYKNTMYTGALWSFGTQHYVRQYSEYLVNTASWTC